MHFVLCVTLSSTYKSSAGPLRGFNTKRLFSYLEMQLCSIWNEDLCRVVSLFERKLFTSRPEYTGRKKRWFGETNPKHTRSAELYTDVSVYGSTMRISSCARQKMLLLYSSYGTFDAVSSTIHSGPPVSDADCRRPRRTIIQSHRTLWTTSMSIIAHPTSTYPT